MSQNFNFTVIIPHHTKSSTDLLKRAVNSIPNDETIQILIVDNSPININNNIFEKRVNVKILYSDKKKGAGHARNIGLQHAKGKWLLFLDADDFFTNNAFKIFEKHLKSSYDIIFFKSTSCYSDTLKTADRHQPYNEIIDKYIIDRDEYNLRFFHEPPWSKLIKRDFINEKDILFDEVLASNDVIFSLKTGIAANKIAIDENIVYCITVNKGSLTNTISLENIESRFYVFIRKNEMLKANGFKKDSSVMFFILSSMKFGAVPFIQMFWKALITGNLFVGYNRWFKTLLISRRSKRKAYKVKK